MDCETLLNLSNATDPTHPPTLHFPNLSPPIFSIMSAASSSSPTPSLASSSLVRGLKRKYQPVDTQRFERDRIDLTDKFAELAHDVEALLDKQDRLINQLFHIIENGHGQSLSELEDEVNDEDEDEDEDDGNESGAATEPEPEDETTVVTAFPNISSSSSSSSSSS